MKNYILYFILFMTVLSFFPKIVCGQGINQIVPNTPEAAALIKLTEYPISMTTGVPDINIPLFEVKVGDLTMPVTLQYHAGGFKINEQSTRVGLGWTMSTDLQVTRTINGKDDFSSGGYASNSLRNSIPYPFYKSSNYTNFPSENIYNMASGQVDGMPDKFSYKLLNKSGSFFFQQNNGGTYIFIPVPYDNVKISFINNQFIITDTDGTVYYFDEKEITGETISPTGTCTNCHVTAWKCTKIISNLGVQEITIGYAPKALKRYKTRTDHKEYYSGYYYRTGSQFGAYYCSDVIPLSELQYFYETQYPFFRISNPKYIDYFADERGPVLHVPYYDRNQGALIDKTFNYWSVSPIINPYNSTSDIQGSSIERIKFRGGSITFNDPDKLTKIVLKDENNSTVKTIDLFQSYKAPYNIPASRDYNGSDFQGTMYLDSLKIAYGDQKYETYALVYNNKYCFGNHLVGHDIWGYPNTYTDEISRQYFSSMPRQFFNEKYYFDLGGWANSMVRDLSYVTTGFDWALAPDENYMKNGVLRRIVYPTGGYVDFDFEANKHMGLNYSIKHYKYGTLDCTPLQLAGGLRIRSINFYNTGETKPTTQKYYKYGEYENGAGVLLYAPEIDFSGKTYKPGAVSVDQYIVYLHGNCSGSTCTRNQGYPVVVEKKTGLYPASVLDYTNENGSSVYYTTVAEYNRDYGMQSGKKVYEYYSPKDFIYPWNASPRVRSTLISYIRTNVYSGMQKAYSEYKFSTKQEFELSRKKTYSYETYKYGNVQVAYADFNIIYNTVSGSGPSNNRDFYDDRYPSPAQPSGLNESDFKYGSYLIPIAKLLLSNETDEIYENSQKITQSTTYTYGNLPSYLQPSKIVTTNSKSESISKSLKYSYDLTGVYSTMASKNMISQVIEEKLRNETIGSDIYTKKTNYGVMTEAGGILPISEEVAYGNATSVIENIFEKYDSYGNILQITGPDKVPISYLWGYSNLYPVAKIEGVAYSEIPSRFISNTSINNPSQDASLRTILTDLRNSFSENKLVTGYTYKYLKGVSSISHPNGSMEYYTYDLGGRLVQVSDNNEKVIERYSYNVIAPQKSSFTLYSVNTPVMKTLSTSCGGYMRSYNAIMFGGERVMSDVELANNSAEADVSDNKGIALLPDCANSSPTVQVKLTGTYSKLYSTSVPARVDVDFIQDGMVKFTKVMPMNEIESTPRSEYLFLPPGDYKISIRTTAANRYYSNGLLLYKFKDLSDTANPTGRRIDNFADVTLVLNKQYDIEIYPVELF